MKIKETFFLRVVCVTLLLAAVCSMAAAGGLSHNDRMRYTYFFQGAMAKLHTGDEKAAFDLLLHCKEINPEASETYFFLADCYEHAGNDSMRIVMLNRAAELNPDNVVYKESLIPVYLNANELDKAARAAEELVADVPERTDMLQLLLQIYSYQDNDKLVLSTLERLEVQEGQTEPITMAKVQIYTKMGNDKLALKELYTLCENHPLDLNYRVMLGNWLLGKKKKKEALSEFQYVLAEEPGNEMALMSMMDYYRAEGNDTLADRQRDNLLLNNKTPLSTRVLLLKQFIRTQEHNSTDSTVVLNFFDRVLEKCDEIEIMELKLAYMSMKNMPSADLKKMLTRILDKQPEHAQARFQLIQMAWEEGNHKEMIALAKPALQFNPDEWAFSYFLGTAYFLDDQVEECVNALELAAEHVDETKNKELAVEMYGLLGDACYKIGRRTEAYAAYENCLRLDPDKASALNNYAYYLSEENRDLDRAAAMSQKSVKAEPDNASYLDTYAWILYLQGRYEEAKIFIDLAMEHKNADEDNSVLIEHKNKIEEKLKKQNAQ